MALSPCKHPPLPNKPGTNYIEQTGGLPHFIDCVARAIFHTGRSQGDVSKAVQIAIGQSENWAEGKGKVSASTRAQAAAAVAQLKAQGAASKAKTAAKNLSDCGCGNLDLSQRITEVVDLAFRPDEPRGFHGRWKRMGAEVKQAANGVSLSEHQHETITSHALAHGGVDHISKGIGGNAVVKFKNGQIHTYGAHGGHSRIDNRPPSGGAQPPLSSAERQAIVAEEMRKVRKSMVGRGNIGPANGAGRSFSGAQIAAMKGQARKRAMERIDALERERQLPKRVNSPAMNLTSDLERRVIDLTERLTS